MASMTPPLILALMLVFQWIDNVAPLSTCQIDCSRFWDGKDKADDPVNCHMYYICFDDVLHSDFSFNCPDGESFDTNTKECKRTGYTCSPKCETCTFDCGTAVLGKAANRVDCSTYYTCGSTIVSHKCPAAAKYFDGDKCQTSEDKCCSCKSECTAYDAGIHKLVPDYRNCTNYYLCVAAGIPDETTHGHCPLGNFDEMTAECSETAPCVQPCAHLYSLTNIKPL